MRQGPVPPRKPQRFTLLSDKIASEGKKGDFCPVLQMPGEWMSRKSFDRAPRKPRDPGGAEGVVGSGGSNL